MNRFWLLLLLLWPVGARAATPIVSVGAYRAQLQNAARQLERMEKSGPRDLGRVLNPLEAPRVVKRSDGATQNLSGAEWTRRRVGLANPKNARRDEVRRARQSVQEHLQALDEWATPKNGAFYTPADAQTIFAQLEKDGQIRVGPSLWEQKVLDWTKAIGDAFTAFQKWLDNLFPTRTPTTAPNVNWNWSWLQWLFWGLVAALLGLVAILVYRALAGRSWGRAGASREAEWDGEDVELLLLPPDELRERAARYAAEGNFREALRHVYLSLLLQFDTRGIWRYDTRRTNWEHIAGLRKNEVHRALVAPLSDLTRRFDRVRYGGAEASQTDWERFSRDVSALETQIGTREAAGGRR